MNKKNVKHIRLNCHEPIALDKNAKQSWSDVYISFIGKPGRRKYFYGPTLVARNDIQRNLEYEIEQLELCQSKEYCDERNESMNSMLQSLSIYFNDDKKDEYIKTQESQINEHSEEIKYLSYLLDKININNIFIDNSENEKTSGYLYET